MENKFLITAFILLFGAVSLIGCIIYYTSPNIWWAGLVLLLGGVVVDIIFGIIYFLARPISGMISPREHFRKGLRKGIVLSVALIALCILQQYLDIV